VAACIDAQIPKLTLCTARDVVGSDAYALATFLSDTFVVVQSDIWVGCL
jgi:hypothetical protein